MELNRYLDLYLSESHDHLRLLNKSLLALEDNDAARGAIEEAFRAAHTLKGMSSTMGFTSVSDMAHGLENLLDQIRKGSRRADAATIDELLAAADTLEQAINAAASGVPAPALQAAAPAQPSTAGPRLQVDAEYYARITLQEEEPMKLARAMILTRSAVSQGLAERSEPAQFGDDFDGEFALILKPAAEEAAVKKLLESASEIARFEIVRAAVEVAAPAAPQAPAPIAPSKTNFVRVDQRRLDEVADSLGEIAILQGRLDQLVSGDHTQLGDMVTRMTRLISELQHSVLAMRMVPVADVFDRFPRMVRDAARALGKEVEFKIEGNDIEIDR
ncbi:MAG TPA: Hpt domain-containing protein, partial [Longimicrobiales bacterium]